MYCMKKVLLVAALLLATSPAHAFFKKPIKGSEFAKAFNEYSATHGLFSAMVEVEDPHPYSFQPYAFGYRLNECVLGTAGGDGGIMDWLIINMLLVGQDRCDQPNKQEQLVGLLMFIADQCAAPPDATNKMIGTLRTMVAMMAAHHQETKDVNIELGSCKMTMDFWDGIGFSGEVK